VPFYTTLIPLVGVLAVTAFKDAFDDIVSPVLLYLGVWFHLAFLFRFQKRHISDYKVNHRVAHVLGAGGL
jgi:hypothetical protein